MNKSDYHENFKYLDEFYSKNGAIDRIIQLEQVIEETHKSRFFKHPEGPLEIGRYKYNNNPINIELVTRIRKTKVEYYGSAAQFTITFDFNSDTEEWLFRNENERDEFFNKI